MQTACWLDAWKAVVVDWIANRMVYSADHDEVKAIKSEMSSKCETHAAAYRASSGHTGRIAGIQFVS